MSGIFAGLLAASGIAQVFVEDVFSTYLYTGNGSTQTITNGIDLSGQGGLVWLKARSNTEGHGLFDTQRGVQKRIQTNSTSSEFTTVDGLSAFNTNGFSVGSGGGVNAAGETYATWTFRKAPNFFDVVTYTGNGTVNHVAHSLGVKPGFIILRRTNAGAPWMAAARNNSGNYETFSNSPAALNSSAAADPANYNPNGLTSTSINVQEFEAGNSNSNASGSTYVAYLFAHDPSADGIIQCGSFTTDGSGNSPQVTLGWEPQWVMFKRTNSDTFGSWQIIDTMRGWVNGSAGGADDYTLFANLSNAEGTAADRGFPTATGFNVGYTGAVSSPYIYVAIRRGPMRTPTLGTSVFSPIARTGTGATATVTAGFPVDFGISAQRPMASSSRIGPFSRLQGAGQVMSTNFVDAEVVRADGVTGFTNTGITVGADSGGAFVNPNGVAVISWLFRRAPSFMDVVCYTGNGNQNLVVNHSLGVAPEMVITKKRTGSNRNWGVYTAFVGTAKKLRINTNEAVINDSFFFPDTPTSTVLNQGNADETNEGGSTYVAYLFASVPGVSKVGSYTGNGSSQTINCVFTTGARFVLVKRTDSTGDWYVWDSARGIVAGDDPYLALNSTAAEVTSNDSVDADSTGFVVNQVAASNINVNAATYIFLAIA